MDYPESIYQTDFNSLVEYAYSLGYHHGMADKEKPSDQYNSLTKAIKEGQPIDWQKLNRMKARLTHDSLGTITSTLFLSGDWRPYTAYGLNLLEGDVLWRALRSAVYGVDGWTLWVEGPIPLLEQ